MVVRGRQQRQLYGWVIASPIKSYEMMLCVLLVFIRKLAC